MDFWVGVSGFRLWDVGMIVRIEFLGYVWVWFEGNSLGSGYDFQLRETKSNALKLRSKTLYNKLREATLKERPPRLGFEG